MPGQDPSMWRLFCGGTSVNVNKSDHDQTFTSGNECLVRDHKFLGCEQHEKGGSALSLPGAPFRLAFGMTQEDYQTNDQELEQ